MNELDDDGSAQPGRPSSVSGGSAWSGLAELSNSGGPYPSAYQTPMAPLPVRRRRSSRWAGLSVAALVLVGGGAVLGAGRMAESNGCDAAGQMESGECRLAAEEIVPLSPSPEPTASEAEDIVEPELTDEPVDEVEDEAVAVVVEEETPTSSPTPRPKVTTRRAYTPPPAPKYTPSQAELLSAQADVESADDALRRLRASPATTREQLQVALYEMEAARYRLKDLKNGTPGEFHLNLEIMGAKAYLAAATQYYREVLSDPTATAADRSQARATVAQWQERLAQLKS